MDRMNLIELDPNVLDDVRLVLLSAGFEHVEGDEDYEMWSLTVGDDAFLDLRLTAVSR